MPVYTDALIKALIECPKTVMDPPRKAMREEQGSRRNDMRLRSEKTGDVFQVFMRINVRFPENFSIGLRHCPADGGGEVLLRCNGPHGPRRGRANHPWHTTEYHVHRARQENIDAGLRAEHGADAVEGYATYDQALAYFLSKVNAETAREHFPEFQRKAVSSLFPDEEVD